MKTKSCCRILFLVPLLFLGAKAKTVTFSDTDLGQVRGLAHWTKDGVDYLGFSKGSEFIVIEAEDDKGTEFGRERHGIEVDEIKIMPSDDPSYAYLAGDQYLVTMDISQPLSPKLVDKQRVIYNTGILLKKEYIYSINRFLKELKIFKRFYLGRSTYYCTRCNRTH